jgi:glycosyltransferase involved in cell wall biosynthesis
MSLTTIILAKNEEKNILDCVLNAKTLGGEILVMDHESVDLTAKIAAENGARVVRESFEAVSESRNQALKEALGDHVFFLDADERVSPELKEAILGFILKHPDSAGAVRRENHAFGRKFRFGPLFPDWTTRIFPKGKVRYEGLVHEKPVYELPTVKLKGALHHHTYDSFKNYLSKQERYARLWASEAREKGKSSGPWKAVSRAFMAFLKMFFLKLGVLGGPMTWALCWYYSSGYTLSKYLLLADKEIKEENKGGEVGSEGDDGSEG